MSGQWQEILSCIRKHEVSRRIPRTNMTKKKKKRKKKKKSAIRAVEKKISTEKDSKSRRK